MKPNPEQILAKLPYTEPFLFVDKLTHVSEKGAEGFYTFKKDEYFYEGHFKENPVTPGVILTECMAQIGVVCLGIYLIELGKNTQQKVAVALANQTVDFYKPVFPGEKVRVQSEKEYFRFGKLKCKVKMWNAAEELICSGFISGMMVSSKQ